MREIKFRAWNKGNNEWLVDDEIAIYLDGSVAAFENKPLPINLFPEYYPLITIVQFTGLYDKNGKEIYEGDILKWKCSHGSITGKGKIGLHTVTIQWGHLTSQHGYSLTIYKNGERYATEKSYWNREDREIIGNIYENPELIEC